MKQTAVEYLELSLLGIISFDSEELRVKYKNAITKAKEIENQECKQLGQITEKGIIDTIGNCANCGVEFHIHKNIEEDTQETLEHKSKFIVFTLQDGEDWVQYSMPLGSFEKANDLCQQFRDKKMSYLICKTLKQGYNGK